MHQQSVIDSRRRCPPSPRGGNDDRVDRSWRRRRWRWRWRWWEPRTFHSKPAEAKAKYRAPPDPTRRNRGSFDGGGLAIREWDSICNITVSPFALSHLRFPDESYDRYRSIGEYALSFRVALRNNPRRPPNQLFPDSRCALIFSRVYWFIYKYKYIYIYT